MFMKVSNNGDAFSSELIFLEPDFSLQPNTSYTLRIFYLIKCDACEGVGDSVSIIIEDGMDSKYFNISKGFNDRWNQKSFNFIVQNENITVFS